MEKQFVPYELALKLKELGFNERCLAYYSGSNLIYAPVIMGKSFPTREVNQYEYFAPLWQQAFDWFRDNHGLDSNIISWKKGDKIFYQFSVKKLGEAGKYKTIECEVEDRYIAQIKCLEKLIEKISNGKK